MAITDYLNKTLTGGTENNTDSPITDLVNKNLGSTTPVAQNATTGNNQTSDQIVGGVNITELANRLKSGQDTIKMPEETSIVSDSESIRNKEDETAAKIIEESNKETQNSQTELAKLKSQAELRTARVAAGLDPYTGEKATAKKTLLSTYEGLYADSGIEKLDTQLNDVNAEIDALNSAKEAVLASVKEKFLLTGKRDLETTEASNNFNEEINKLQDKANLLTNQINTKTSAISTIMKYTETDYNTASSQYQTDFDNNYKLMSYYDTKSSNEVITATSNLNTMSSALSNANLTWEEIDDATKAKISQLELEAGIPTGYTKAILSAMPSFKTESSKFSYDTDGNEVFVQVGIDGDGQTKVITTKTGNKKSEELSEAEIKREYIENLDYTIRKGKDANGNPIIGEDGYISPSSWKAAKDAWLLQDYDEDDFEVKFNKYKNPTNEYYD